jgi:hypothetical protein
MTAVIDAPRAARRPHITGTISRLAKRAAETARTTAERLSGSLLTITGLGCIDVGAFDAHPIAGWVTTGVTVLLLDWLRE